MVDVGCGIGGSSRHIACKFGCTAKGITLSPVQVGLYHLLVDQNNTCVLERVTSMKIEFSDQAGPSTSDQQPDESELLSLSQRVGYLTWLITPKALWQKHVCLPRLAAAVCNSQYSLCCGQGCESTCCTVRALLRPAVSFGRGWHRAKLPRLHRLARGEC